MLRYSIEFTYDRRVATSPARQGVSGWMQMATQNFNIVVGSSKYGIIATS